MADAKIDSSKIDYCSQLKMICQILQSNLLQQSIVSFSVDIIDRKLVASANLMHQFLNGTTLRYACDATQSAYNI